jgi:hypothetical protein
MRRVQGADLEEAGRSPDRRAGATVGRDPGLWAAPCSVACAGPKSDRAQVRVPGLEIDATQGRGGVQAQLQSASRGAATRGRAFELDGGARRLTALM